METNKMNEIAAAVELTRMVVQNKKERGDYLFDDDIGRIYERMRKRIGEEERKYV